jgi:effector-binding domain-containing protein
MIETPTIVETQARPAAVIRFTIPKDEIHVVMGPAFAELYSTIITQGIGPAGPAFSRHFKWDPDEFDFEVGVPVSAPVTPTGRVTAGELPGGRVVRTVYHGGYEGLGAGWGEFMERVREMDVNTLGPFREVYTVGPESGLDETGFRTELSVDID